MILQCMLEPDLLVFYVRACRGNVTVTVRNHLIPTLGIPTYKYCIVCALSRLILFLDSFSNQI